MDEAAREGRLEGAAFEQTGSDLNREGINSTDI